MKTEIEQAIALVCHDLFSEKVEVVLTRPDEQFGDYATNVALQLGKKLNKNPKEIADKLAAAIKSKSIKSLEVAEPGFLNFKLSDGALWNLADQEIAQTNKDHEILVEFGDPNPFKEMHIGHLYSSIVGDSISRLIEASGADVKRLSYHGDVGLHIAKAIFGLREIEKQGKSLLDVPILEREKFLGVVYSVGADKYENDEKSKAEIDDINTHIYKKDDPEINELHKKGCELSFSYFDKIFRELGIKYDKNGRYLESDTIEIGLEFVRKNIGKVFQESDGAIVYKGEKTGLHTRVFITSKGLPTYEAKDLGLTELKNKDYPNAARSIIITANEQTEYFKVMLAALSEIDESLASKTTHLSHGFLSLSTGKMSSRTGNVYAATDLLNSVRSKVDELYPDSKINDQIYVSAVKYAFLKHRLGQDIVVNVDEAASLEGNSGPYLQYAHARACSILGKSKALDSDVDDIEDGERSLLRKIGEYTEVVDKTVEELMPHHICTYLYELAQVFNRFYEGNRVIDDPREVIRIKLVKKYTEVLKSGLELLNIQAPEKM